MARPGPKPNNDHLISERLDIMEQLLHHVLGDRADETANRLLRELGELRTRQAHRCEVCTKSYSDAKGLRRHILTADERHAALAGQLSALACRWCGRGYAKREQVTKHENICADGGRIMDRDVSAETGPPAEPEGGPSQAQLPKAVVSGQGTVRLPPMRLIDPASAHTGYYAEDDI